MQQQMELEQPVYIGHLAPYEPVPVAIEYQGQDAYPDGDMGQDSETDSGGEGQGACVNYKSKPRRKATQKPVSSDQKRQAFSKRKRGIVLKGYQLYKLTDAKVFMFLVNDKGSSWAYASPGYGASLHPSHLRRMRELAGLPHSTKHTTEVMPHPRTDDVDRAIDDRHLNVGAEDTQPVVLRAPPPRSHPSNGSAPRDGSQRPGDRNVRPRLLPSASVTTTSVQPTQSLPRAVVADAHVHQQLNGLQETQQQQQQQQEAVQVMAAEQYQYQADLPDDPYNDAVHQGQAGTVISPSGQVLAATVGVPLHANNIQGRPGQELSAQGTTDSRSSDQHVHTMSFNHNNSFTCQIVTDSAGNMYRMVRHDATPSKPPPSVPLPLPKPQLNPATHPVSSLLQHAPPPQHPQHIVHMPPHHPQQVQHVQHVPRMYQPPPSQQVPPQSMEAHNHSGLATLAAAAAAANVSSDVNGGANPGLQMQGGGMQYPRGVALQGMTDVQQGMKMQNGDVMLADSGGGGGGGGGGGAAMLPIPAPQMPLQQMTYSSDQHTQYNSRCESVYVQNAQHTQPNAGHVTFVQRAPQGYQLQHTQPGAPQGMFITGYMPGELQSCGQSYPQGSVMLVPGDWGGSGGMVSQRAPDGVWTGR